MVPSSGCHSDCLVLVLLADKMLGKVHYRVILNTLVGWPWTMARETIMRNYVFSMTHVLPKVSETDSFPEGHFPTQVIDRSIKMNSSGENNNRSLFFTRKLLALFGSLVQFRQSSIFPMAKDATYTPFFWSEIMWQHRLARSKERKLRRSSHALPEVGRCFLPRPQERLAMSPLALMPNPLFFCHGILDLEAMVIFSYLRKGNRVVTRGGDRVQSR